MSKWIEFVLIKQGEKTNVWNVDVKSNKATLGQIKWYSGWRKYSFFPLLGTLYEPTCLRDIASFIEEQMNIRRRI